LECGLRPRRDLRLRPGGNADEDEDEDEDDEEDDEVGTL
jgi:hypothetical protein